MGNGNDFTGKCRALTGSRGQQPDAERFRELLALDWKRRLQECPEEATYLGYAGHDHRWTDYSFSAVDRRKQQPGQILEVLQSIDDTALSAGDRLSYRLLKREMEILTAGSHYPSELLPISQIHGIQQGVPRLLAMMPVGTPHQVDNILARMEALPPLVEQTKALLERGLACHITPTAFCLRDVPRQIREQVVEPPDKAPMLAAFQKLPDTLSSAVRQRAADEARRLYLEKAVPALQALERFVTESYLPQCRRTTAWVDLADGEEWYRHLVREHTTTGLSPEEIFQIGQSEVRRIRGEMDDLIKGTDFQGDFASFCEFLRTDGQFYFDRAEDLVRTYRDIAKRADPHLARLFGVLPRLPYGVIEIPSYSARSQTTAYYQPGSMSAGRPGYYYVNTYDLRSRPKWEMEALTLHEAVPGHHLQIALAQELEGLPDFRRHSWITAYGEGWALYAESLGESMGFYNDSYARFGQLAYEMWRAIRLVLDVGLHLKRWSRRQAIEYFTKNSGKAEHDIAVEVDRYTVWPAQALAYKIGEMKIRELRAYAQQVQGEQFDIRAFHDKLLEHGCLPLDLLEDHVKAWIAGGE